MAWERREKCSYFYRTVRQEGKVKKIYYGAGAAGEIAAKAVALHQAERKTEHQTRRETEERLSLALALAREFYRACDLLAAANLLAAGYHRYARHPWRVWHHGRRVLKAST